MRLGKTLQMWACALGATTLMLGGCSGSQEDEEKLAVEGEEGEEGAKAEGEGEANAAAEPEAPTDAASGLAAAIPEPSNPAPVATPEPAPAATPAPVAAAPAGTAADKSRVVRYVSSSEASIRGAPQDAAETVGKLMKGDKVLVIEENGWGRIADNMFIKLEGLSQKAVPRDRQPAVWIAPTH